MIVSTQPLANSTASRVRCAQARLYASSAALALRFGSARRIDFWLQEVDPRWSLSSIRARVVDIWDETHDVRTFVLAPNWRWPGHRAGQFVTVDVEVAGVRLRRCYSISSAPSRENAGQATVAITVKRVAGGRVSSWMHDQVRRGHILELGAPTGDFVLPTESARDDGKLLLLSGGSGITPIMSILRDLANHGKLRDVVFVHAARTILDVPFYDELEQLARLHARELKVIFAVETDVHASRATPPSATDRAVGRLSSATLRSRVPDLGERLTMLCGPVGMMDALAPTWVDAGLGHRLKMERFVSTATVRALASLPDGAPRKNVRLTLVRSGRTVTTEDTTGTLLMQLEDAGEKPAHGCRMGVCNTCRCTMRSGVVENMLTGARSSEPNEEIRLCVSRALSDVELAI